MTTSYGSITIVDITDVGEFSLYPTSNMPLSVIYSPDDGIYTPNWGTNNLNLTPTLYYAGNPIALTASGVTITWTKQIGSAAPTAISASAGESVSNGVLTVAQNQFNTTTSLVTYICTGQYVEPETNQTLTAVGQITFSLVKNAATVKTCNVTGQSVFKYAADQSTVSPSSITLTATLSDTVTNGNWQYLNNLGQFVNLPITAARPSINGSTVTIAATEDSLFNNRVATIKKLTSDADTYDIVNITKLYDGVAGDSNFVMALTNDNQLIPCDADGDPTIDLNEIVTEVVIYEGSDDVTSDWSVSVSRPTGITGTFTNNVFTLTGWTTDSDTASIIFTATKTNNAPLTKTLTLAKVKTGTDGTSPEYYELICPTVVTNRNINKSFSPASVTFTANKIVGNTKTSYQGFLKIYTVDTGGNRTEVQGAGNMSTATTPPSLTYTFADPSSSTTLASVEVELYQTGGSGAILDKQTIVVADDGQTGAKGDGAYTIILGNSHESIACDSEGTVKTQTVVNIPFTCYKGTQRAAATITTSNITGIPTGSGITPAVSSNASTSGSGLITLTFPATKLNNSSGSEITLTFTITENSQTVPMKFSWNKTLAGQVGNDAVILQVFAPQGDIIQNGTNNVILSTQLTEGATVVESGITYQWSQFDVNANTTLYSDKYVPISGETNSTLTVTPSMVSGYASFKCTATYKNNPYRAYGAVRDKSDPLQVEVFSSLGQQLINGVGYGAVYARIYLNGEEVDQIQTTEFVTSTSLATGTKCYLLDTTNKLCTYKVKSGNSWVTGTEGYTGTYTWTFRNKDGETVSYNGSNSYTGKVLYIDGSLIDTKVIFDVEVSYGAS